MLYVLLLPLDVLRYCNWYSTLIRALFVFSEYCSKRVS